MARNRRWTGLALSIAGIAAGLLLSCRDESTGAGRGAGPDADDAAVRLDIQAVEGPDALSTDGGVEPDSEIDAADGSSSQDGSGEDLAGDGAPDGGGEDLAGDVAPDGADECPIAVARARVQGSGDPWSARLEANPLDTLELDGRDSLGESDIVAFEWEVADRPSLSVSELTPSDRVATPTFFLDLAGTYLFRLQVVDAMGLTSCQPAEVMVRATGCCRDIHVQLVWESVDGNDADLDLHLLHPLGTWDEPPHDCFSANPNPNWGDASSAGDDPSLDIDSADGVTPENINLAEPEGSREEPFVYRIGVLHKVGGTSDATVRIFVDGGERFAATFPNLAAGQFWDVARIEWPTGQITRIHRLYPSGIP